jgi:hypothetical protein
MYVLWKSRIGLYSGLSVLYYTFSKLSGWVLLKQQYSGQYPADDNKFTAEFQNSTETFKQNLLSYTL